MLSTGKVREVERLLSEGTLSQRKIALAVGVSRGVVSAIASGRRPDYAARQQDREDSLQPQGPIERCPTCGGRVYMPCRLCHVRGLQAREQALLARLRRRARQEAVKRLLAAVLRAAESEETLSEAEAAGAAVESAGHACR